MDITNSPASCWAPKCDRDTFCYSFGGFWEGCRHTGECERSNCQPLRVWQGPAGVENGFQRRNNFMELFYHGLNFVLVYLTGGRCQREAHSRGSNLPFCMNLIIALFLMPANALIQVTKKYNTLGLRCLDLQYLPKESSFLLVWSLSVSHQRNQRIFQKNDWLGLFTHFSLLSTYPKPAKVPLSS